MLKTIYTSLILSIVIMIISSCQKDITIDIPANVEKLVVEGYVEQGLKPVVYLSKSVDYYAEINSTTVLDLAITDAKVWISDGQTTDTLAGSFTLDRFPFWVYESNNIVGEIGKTYDLMIETADGKTYSSKTKINTPVPLDSVWFEVFGDYDSLGFAWALFEDPDTLGNNYRWLAKRNTKDDDFVFPLGSEFDDRFINGKKFEIAFQRGSVYNSEAEDDNNEEEGFFKKGDTVTVKFCTIEPDVYEFWRKAETEIFNNGNPFAAPTTVPTNIEGGAIGVWCGYGASYHTFIAPK